MKAAESGILFGLNTNFDLSANTQLDITITDPSGVESIISPSRITAPVANASFIDNGVSVTYLANEYMQFTTLVTDFTIAGRWKICGTFTNTATNPDQIFYVNEKILIVDNGC